MGRADVARGRRDRARSGELEVAGRRARRLARLDYTQNAINKTLVAPYSPRPAPGAPVSVPIEWDELDDPELAPGRAGPIRTIRERLAERGDLFARRPRPHPAAAGVALTSLPRRSARGDESHAVHGLPHGSRWTAAGCGGSNLPRVRLRVRPCPHLLGISSASPRGGARGARGRDSTAWWRGRDGRTGAAHRCCAKGGARPGRRGRAPRPRTTRTRSTTAASPRTHRASW